MAVIDKFEVKVNVGGADVLELIDDDQEDKENVVTRYLEAASSSYFDILFKILPGYQFNSYSLRFYVRLDGKEAGSFNIYRDQYDSSRGTEWIRGNPRQIDRGVRTFLKYKFAPLHTRKCAFSA